MVKQMLNKFIVVLIVLVLTSGNLMLIGTETYAAFENLEEQKRESSDKNVSFDAYFYTNQSKIHSATLDTKQEAYMNFEVDIENGYLKESVLDEVGALVSLFIEEKPLCSYDLHKPRYDEICRYGELGKRVFSTIEWCKEEARIETLKNLTYPYLGGVGISNLVVLKELSKDKVRVKN